MPKVITYECSQCGTEVVVTETLETELRPIYCCGLEVTEISALEKKKARPAKKAAGKALKKAVKKSPQKTAKKTAPKKKAPAKKKTSGKAK